MRMRIGPEAERTMFRLIPQADLYRPFMSSVLYVKRFDSTHPMVRELKEYCDSPFSPVSVMAASAIHSRKNSIASNRLKGFQVWLSLNCKSSRRTRVVVIPGFTFETKGENLLVRSQIELLHQRFLHCSKKILLMSHSLSRENVSDTVRIGSTTCVVCLPSRTSAKAKSFKLLLISH